MSDEILSARDRQQLEVISIQLQDVDLPPTRRDELLEIAESIAEKYAYDPRLCE